MNTSETNDPVLKVNSLEVRAGKKSLLRGFDLDLPAGSVTALVGGNGAGKSTLLRILAGELRPAAGKVSVLGLDPWRSTSAVRQRMAWVPERTDLPRWMRVRDHLRLVAPFYPKWDAAEAQRLLEAFALAPDAHYRNLSKGERMLENLTVALAARPEVLLLDEPFSGLDVGARRDVFAGILEHLRGSGTSVLLASHSIVDVERCADRIVLIARGRAVVTDELDSLLARSSRLRILLRPSCAQGWQPPGNALVESQAKHERVVFYPRLTDEDRQAIATDPAVDYVEELKRDLEDILAAASHRPAA